MGFGSNGLKTDFKRSIRRDTESFTDASMKTMDLEILLKKRKFAGFIMVGIMI